MSYRNNSTNFPCISIESIGDDLSQNIFMKIVFGFLYGAIIFFSLVGNSSVVVTIIRHKNLHTVRNWFLVNLALSDIIVSFVSGLVTPITTFRKIWIFGEVLCRIVPFLQACSTWISTTSLALIAIDRFILIIFPAQNPIQPKLAVKIIAALWLVVFTIDSPVIFRQGLIPLQLTKSGVISCGKFCVEIWKNTAHRRFYGLAVLVLQFAVPLLIILICYACIYMKINKRRFAATSRSFERTNRLLVMMVVAFVICWLPLISFHTLRDFDLLPKGIRSEEYFIAIVLHWIAMTSTCWNPVLYALLNDQLRKAFFGERKKNNDDLDTARGGTTLGLRIPSLILNSPKIMKPRCSSLQSSPQLDEIKLREQRKRLLSFQTNGISTVVD